MDVMDDHRLQVSKPVVKRRGKSVQVHLPAPKKKDRFASKLKFIRHIISGKLALRGEQNKATNSGDVRSLQQDEETSTMKSGLSDTRGPCPVLQGEEKGNDAKPPMIANIRHFFQRKEEKGQSLFRMEGKHARKSTHSAPSLPKKIWSSLRKTDQVDYDIGGSESVDESWNFERIIDDEDDGPDVRPVKPDPEKSFTHWTYDQNVYKVKDKRGSSHLLELSGDNHSLEDPPRSPPLTKTPPMESFETFEFSSYSETSALSDSAFTDDTSEDASYTYPHRRVGRDPCAPDSLFDSAELAVDAFLNSLVTQSSEALSFWNGNPSASTTQRRIHRNEPSDILPELGLHSTAEGKDGLVATRAMELCGTGTDAVLNKSNDSTAVFTGGPRRNRLNVSDSMGAPSSATKLNRGTLSKH